MKQISQEEFEQYVEAIIRGDMSRAQVVKELQTEARTLNNRIQELAGINPELHRRYVEKHPYRPKERKDINAVQLAIEILEDDKTIEELITEHQVSRRTIRRKLDSLKNSEDKIERDLYELCRVAGRIYSRRMEKSDNFVKAVNELLSKIERDRIEPAKSRQSNVEEKRAELLELERKYNELCQTMSKQDAAREVGYTPNRIFKLLNALYRIEIERAASAPNRDFRQGLKVEIEGISEGKREVAAVVEEKSEEKEIE